MGKKCALLASEGVDRAETRCRDDGLMQTQVLLDLVRHTRIDVWERSSKPLGEFS